MLRKVVKGIITGILAIVLAIGVLTLYVSAVVQQQERAAAQVNRGY